MDFEPLTTTNIVTIAGWIVAAILAVITAAVTRRAAAAKKVLSWWSIGESNLLSADALSDPHVGFGVPISVLIGGREERDVSTVRVRIKNTGNTELENLRVPFFFGTGATVYVGRYMSTLGVYQEKLVLLKDGERATLDIKHINVQQIIEIEFLVAQYRLRTLRLDMAEPGVTLVDKTTRIDPNEIGIP